MESGVGSPLAGDVPAPVLRSRRRAVTATSVPRPPAQASRGAFGGMAASLMRCWQIESLPAGTGACRSTGRVAGNGPVPASYPTFAPGYLIVGSSMVRDVAIRDGKTISPPGAKVLVVKIRTADHVFN
ncbi:hypothetical protein AAFF_G00263960 [Aldrovandia affinis]|uniref:Uncharacterized protein n=1 Tax=Aldrovandia affinis TaxID=143900 RepID=A0AAD7SU07_9TELE|nr:hypothetical protein AAFF_G00263960 [Aldrovandia affinis]